MLSAKQHQELQELAFIGADFELDALSGGTVNQSYCLRSVSGRYFLKLFCQNGGDRQDRHRQFALQQQIAGFGMAPAPLYLSAAGDFMLETWLDIQDLATSKLVMQDKLICLAQRLAAIHALPIQCADLPLVEDWQHYIKVGNIQTPALLDDVARASRLWQALPKPVFSHHDLSFAHVCLSPDAMCLDWEYAAMSTPAYDLASSILAQGLNDAQSRVLCDEYARICALSAELLWQDIQQMLPIARLTNQLWHLAQNPVKQSPVA